MGLEGQKIETHLLKMQKQRNQIHGLRVLI